MKNFLVTAVLLILIVLFASLQSFWKGLVYFALSFLIVLCLYWLIILLLQYINDYYKTFDEDFKIYCSEIINSTSATSQDINDNIDYYRKKYKKSILRDKLFDIAKMLVAISIIASSILGMITI